MKVHEHFKTFAFLLIKYLLSTYVKPFYVFLKCKNLCITWISFEGCICKYIHICALVFNNKYQFNNFYLRKENTCISPGVVTQNHKFKLPTNSKVRYGLHFSKSSNKTFFSFCQCYQL